MVSNHEGEHAGRCALVVWCDPMAVAGRVSHHEGRQLYLTRIAPPGTAFEGSVP